MFQTESNTVSFTSSTNLRPDIAKFIASQGGWSRPPAVYDHILELHGSSMTQRDLECFENGKEIVYKYNTRWQVHPQMSNPDEAGEYLLIKSSKESGRGIWQLREDALERMIQLEIISEEQSEIYKQTIQQKVETKFIQNMNHSLHNIFPSNIPIQTIQAHLLSELSDNTIVQYKKRCTVSEFNHMLCEICECNMKKEYYLDTHYAHCHHKQLKSTYSPGQVSTFDDLAIVCPKCHEAIHKKGCISIEIMRDIYWRIQSTLTGRISTFPNGVPSLTQEWWKINERRYRTRH